MKLDIHHFDLPLRHTFTISRGSIDVQPTLIVELQEGGVRGYGEATTNDYYGYTLENMTAALETLRDQIESFQFGDPTQLWELVAADLKDNPFAHCALDQAAYDLWGKLEKKPVYQLWGLETDQTPLTNYTIGIDTIEVMVEKMQEFPNWPVYKIKLGTVNDLEIVRALREHTQSAFRVDANCGWTAQQTIDFSAPLKDLGVEFIEQPLPAECGQEMQQVKKESALPLIADESCIVETDVAQCQNGFHGVNVKLVKCGGLTPARRMISEAKELGLKVMVGCMTESTVGISAIAQLLPLLDYVDMDGALLLSKDIATGVTIDQGGCVYPDANGNGVELSR